jgi:hypothetical protein
MELFIESMNPITTYVIKRLGTRISKEDYDFFFFGFGPSLNPLNRPEWQSHTESRKMKKERMEVAVTTLLAERGRWERGMCCVAISNDTRN